MRPRRGVYRDFFIKKMKGEVGNVHMFSKNQKKNSTKLFLQNQIIK